MVLQAYHLPTNAGFQGRLTIEDMVLGNEEFLIDMDPPALIHLNHLSDHKCYVPTQSYSRPFLYSVIFEVSKDDKQVEQDFGILNISFVSVQKYCLFFIILSIHISLSINLLPPATKPSQSQRLKSIPKQNSHILSSIPTKPQNSPSLNIISSKPTKIPPSL